MELQKIVADLIAENQEWPSAADVARRMEKLYLAGELWVTPPPAVPAPSRPQVLATPEGWARLDEAGNQIAGTGVQQCLGTGMQQAQEHGTFPPLTFRPEEWRMGERPALTIDRLGTFIEAVQRHVVTETDPVSGATSYSVTHPADTQQMLDWLRLPAPAQIAWSNDEPEPDDDIMSAVRAVARGS